MRHVFTILLLTLSLALAQEPARKRETLLLLPEPRALRSALSITPPGAKLTVLTPARESASSTGKPEAYSTDAFQALGLSVETFIKRAAAAADKRLAAMKPDLIRDEQGRVLYAVYRGESELYASLLIAPSLPKIFEPMFGKELWAALPDRHALYIFPAQSAALQDFGPDLAARYADDPFAASGEVFSLKSGEEPRVIAGFVPAEE